MKIKFLGLMLLAVVMVFAIVSCGPTPTPTEPAGNDYTITFEGADVAAITVAENTAATKPADPTKTGYTFAGWTYAGEAWDWENIVVSDMTLTATWTAVEYALTLELDGGALAAPLTAYTIEGCPLPVPTKDGFAFAGWSNGTDTVTAIAPGTTGALTLTAIWVEQADFVQDFETSTLFIHYADPQDSWVHQNYGQYKSMAGGDSDGYMFKTDIRTAEGDLTWGDYDFEFFKNAKNWHELKTEDGNTFFRCTIATDLARYAKFTANEDYNVGVFAFTNKYTTMSAEDNFYTVSFDIRMKNEGAFGLNVYARATNNKYVDGQDRVTLLTIDKDGSLKINADTVNTARNRYTDGADKLAEDTIGSITIGAWNTIKFEMLATDGGHMVTIYCNGTKLNETAFFLDNGGKDVSWNAAADGQWDRLMVFGGAAAGVTAVDSLGVAYSNDYDFDNFTVNGSYVEIEE